LHNHTRRVVPLSASGDVITRTATGGQQRELVMRGRGTGGAIWRPYCNTWWQHSLEGVCRHSAGPVQAIRILRSHCCQTTDWQRNS